MYKNASALEALSRIKEWLEAEEQSHLTHGNTGEAAEINDLLVDAEEITLALQATGAE